MLAAKLYEAAGVKVPELSLIKDENGKLGISSKIEQSFKSAQRSSINKKLRTDVEWDDLPGIQTGLAADAWLANWDVVGLEYDCVIYTPYYNNNVKQSII